MSLTIEEVRARAKLIDNFETCLKNLNRACEINGVLFTFPSGGSTPITHGATVLHGQLSEIVKQAAIEHMEQMCIIAGQELVSRSVSVDYKKMIENAKRITK